MDCLSIHDLGRMAYGEALALQRHLVEQRRANALGDTLLMVEHPPVLTLGVRGDWANIYLPRAELAAAGVEIFEVERGGDVTYHGPGQLVGYPIINLHAFEGGIRAFISAMAQSIIDVLRDDFGIAAEQRHDRLTGVWVGDAKIAAFGIAVRHGVTMHGFAFNVNTDLRHFDWINPCGLSKGVTSVQRETGAPADLETVRRRLVERLCARFGKLPDPRPLDGTGRGRSDEGGI